MSRLLAAALFLAVAACTAPSQPQTTTAVPRADEFVFAFWNVENLFDAEDDPANPGDDEYLPAEGWTPERYATKLDRLATVVAAVRPHVLGFAEVENRRVLDELARHPELASLRYEIVHRDSPDGRGIDVALAYRAPFSLASEGAVALHEVEADGRRATRGILEVRLDVGGAPLTVLVNHWPSRGGDRDGAYRRIVAERARAVVDRIVADAATDGREADVLIVGDFNDDPFDPSVREVLGAVRSRNAAMNRREDRPLYNPSWSLLGTTDLGTLYYNAEWVWNVFDQAIVSRGLLDDLGFTYVEGSLDVHAPDALRDHYRRPLRFRKGRDGEWEEGYSDHFMIHGRLRLAAP